MKTILAWLALGACSWAPAADWPQFLGPTRNGHAGADEKALPDQFSGDPKVLWEYEVGSGHAGPAVIDGKVIVIHRQAGDVLVEALDVDTGMVLWKFSYATEYRDSFGMDEGPRATPTVSGGRVFVHGAEGIIHALSLADGKLLWEVDTAKDFNSPQGYFGRVCAPLVADGRVIVTTGGSKAVVAFDEKDGHVLWSSGEDDASYASPVLSSPKILTCWLRNNLTTFDIVSGKVLSAEHFRPAIDASVSAATPIKTDHGWFISAEYDVGASLWDIGESGSLKKTWSGEDAISCHYATPVYLDGFVYGFDGRQETGQTLRCWNTTTHEVKWISPRMKGGTLLMVKDKLVVLTESGELWVVPATPKNFEPQLTAQILRAGHRSYPAFSRGVVYARDANKLVAVRLAQ